MSQSKAIRAYITQVKAEGWWISLEFGGRNRSIVPRDVFEKFPDTVKNLYRHPTEEAENPIRKH